jgi:hypothetical protein
VKRAHPRIVAFLAALFVGATATAASDSSLDAALAERAAGRASLDDIEIEASWQHEKGNRSVHIWGSGVGIWENSVQFRLSREQVLELVQLLLDAKVGEIPRPGAKPSGAAPKAPLQQRGELIVVAGEQRTQLQQLTRGEQSEALGRLVARILELCEKAAAGGIRASSLEDGLAKVADGTLAPQAFTASVRRQTTASQPEGDSYQLRMRGRRVIDRMMPRGEKPPAPRELTLSDADFRKLVGGIRAGDPASFARTTYAPTYTDVTIAVLDHERNVPARPYLDVTPETHGEKQKAFDRVYALLRALHERVQKEGTAVEETPGRAPVRVAPPTPSASPAKP